MEVGMQFIFQNTHEGMTDAEMFRQEAKIPILAEEVGMDFCLFPEHHFDPNYSMMPDNMQFVAYIGGQTSRIKLGTGAIIVPWWYNKTDPTRIAERIAMLDILLGDRFLLGFGRGLARMEYETFGVDMNESRERFDEAVRAHPRDPRDGGRRVRHEVLQAVADRDPPDAGARLPRSRLLLGGDDAGLGDARPPTSAAP